MRKWLISIIWLMAASVCYAQKHRHTRSLTFRQHRFALALQSHEGGERCPNSYIIFTKSAYRLPVSMDGERIYTAAELNPPPEMLRDSTPELLLLSGLADVWSRLDDGYYYLDMQNIVIDKNGRICYYETYGLNGEAIHGENEFAMPITISPAMADTINRHLEDVTATTQVATMATIKGKPVTFRYNGCISSCRITVKDHNVDLGYYYPKQDQSSW